jgi:glycosyltransferase involved in cell wall biosynthesis
LGVAPSARLLTIVGRIDAQKNQHSILPVLRVLAAEGTDAHLALVGPVTDPAYLGRINADAKALGLEGRVHVVDGLPPGGGELVGAYHASDCVLVPSRHEPFGIVILEAWAAGAPVVAHRVGGIPTFAEHGRTALLVEPGDTGEWIRSIRGVLEGGDRAGRMAERARQEARLRYDWEQVASAYQDLYADVIQEQVA